MTHDQKAHEETDPEGLPIHRRLSNQGDEIAPTSSGITPTSPTPLTARPSGAGAVGQSDPGQPAAREVAVESAKSPAKSAIPEYRAPASRLPEVITARQVANDRSNPDGCQAFEVQR